MYTQHPQAGAQQAGPPTTHSKIATLATRGCLSQSSTLTLTHTYARTPVGTYKRTHKHHMHVRMFCSHLAYGVVIF